MPGNFLRSQRLPRKWIQATFWEPRPDEASHCWPYGSWEIVVKFNAGAGGQEEKKKEKPLKLSSSVSWQGVKGGNAGFHTFGQNYKQSSASV